MDSKELKGLMEAYAEVYAPQEEIEEATYSAKAARAGKDIGKPGKAFAKIAKEAGKRYGSKERGEKVAGAVLAKLRKQHEEVEIDEAVKGADPEMRKAAAAERRVGDKPLSKKVGDANAAHMARKIRFSDKVTKAKGHIPGYTYAEEVDIFDSVLDYLVAEGYANNNQEALYIMANLSEEEILEYRKLAAAAVGGLMALNMMKPGIPSPQHRSPTPERERTELPSSQRSPGSTESLKKRLEDAKKKNDAAAAKLDQTIQKDKAQRDASYRR